MDVHRQDDGLDNILKELYSLTKRVKVYSPQRSNNVERTTRRAVFTHSQQTEFGARRQKLATVKKPQARVKAQWGIFKKLSHTFKKAVKGIKKAGKQQRK